ncbi:hypothetical protein STEG23_028686, partial [Scotinomys teguina]
CLMRIVMDLRNVGKSEQVGKALMYFQHMSYVPGISNIVESPLQPYLQSLSFTLLWSPFTLTVLHMAIGLAFEIDCHMLHDNQVELLFMYSMTTSREGPAPCLDKTVELVLMIWGGPGSEDLRAGELTPLIATGALGQQQDIRESPLSVAAETRGLRIMTPSNEHRQVKMSELTVNCDPMGHTTASKTSELRAEDRTQALALTRQALYH